MGILKSLGALASSSQRAALQKPGSGGPVVSAIPNSRPKILIPLGGSLHHKILGPAPNQDKRRKRSLSHKRRRSLRSPKRLPGWWTNRDNLGSLAQFKDLITKPQSGRDTILVALDTEYKGPIVTEIGLTTLRVSDIQDLQPDKHLAAWMQKMEHYHFVLRGSTSGIRPKTARFAKSQRMSVTETCAAVFKIWRRLLPPTKSEANVALIGHSLDGDIDVLRNVDNLADNVRILLRDDPRLRVTHLFDTQHFARGSELNFASVSLADLASSLDIAPEYRDDRGMIAGWHNASNDAAYTMLTALFMATRNPGDALISPTRSAMQHRNLPSSPSAWREWSRARQVRRRSVKLQRRKERQEKQKRREAVKAHRKQRLSSTSAWLEQKAKQKLRKADDVLREALRTLRPRTRNASSKWMQGAKWMLQGGCYITLVYVFAITSQAAVGFF